METGFARAELIAVLTAITDGQPRVMTVNAGNALPSGPFASTHRSLQATLRNWIEAQTGHPVGFLEQLYTFADLDREPESGTRRISIGYLGLVTEQKSSGGSQPEWHGWYEYFPWEDRRDGAMESFAQISDRLKDWAASNQATRTQSLQRVSFLFGLDPCPWNEDLVLQRYELMYEAGLVMEAGMGAGAGFGRPMQGDHRRILATAMARLRAKLKYRTIVFELLPETFTLLQLQHAMEALVGLRLHKPNFRRLVDQQNLIEPTGETTNETGGRPAKLFRYRPAIVEERALAGTRLPVSRN